MNKPIVHRLAILLLCVVLCTVTATALAYEKIDADLVLHEGKGKSIAIKIVNLTPYQMTLDQANSSLTGPGNAANRNRQTDKYFVFAPLGAPQVIPAVSLQSIPYPMVIAFKDGDTGSEIVNSATASWTLNNVPDDPKNKAKTANPRFVININRQVPEENKSGLFPLVASCLFEAFDFLELAAEPVNPFAWAEVVVGLIEIGNNVSEFIEKNKEGKDGTKVYVSAYMAPQSGYGRPATQWVPGSKDTNGPWSDDGVVTQEATMNGYAASSFIVSTQVLRKPVPQMTVTILPVDVYAAAITSKTLREKATSSKGAGELKLSMQQQGKHGKKTLLRLVRSLSRQQQLEMVEAAKSIHFGHSLNQEQESLLSKMASAHKLQAASIE